MGRSQTASAQWEETFGIHLWNKRCSSLTIEEVSMKDLYQIYCHLQP